MTLLETDVGQKVNSDKLRLFHLSKTSEKINPTRMVENLIRSLKIEQTTKCILKIHLLKGKLNRVKLLEYLL